MRRKGDGQPRRSKAVDAHVGRRIRIRRIEMGLTQHKLGLLISVSLQRLQKYENGTNRISGSGLWRVSEALGVEPGYFFEGVSRARDKRADGNIGSAPHGHSERETLELIKAYKEIDDPQVRMAVRQMLHAYAQSRHAARSRSR